MAIVNILDVARLCRLEIDERTLGCIEVQANCPFCNDKKKHLYLNTQKQKFNCQKCKVGGDATRLYELNENLNRETAFSRLINNPDVYVSTSYAPVQKVNQYELRSLEERHAVYLNFLKLLHLSSFHRQNLNKRGLSDEIIDGNMYKTVPLDFVERDRILYKLLENHDLKGIPGFYFNEKKGSWMMTAKAGFFVPVCTKDNLIQGMQIRLDRSDDNKKYRWFSSSKYNNGCAAHGWIHVTGDISSGTVNITEGSLKSDIASYLTCGGLFVGLPGADSLNYLEETLLSLNPYIINECLDMDKFTNEWVIKARRKVEQLSKRHCLTFESCKWNPGSKGHRNGIDDYLLHRNNYQNNIAA